MKCDKCGYDDKNSGTFAPHCESSCLYALSIMVDRHIRPVPRRVVDWDINGSPIYADQVGVQK